MAQGRQVFQKDDSEGMNFRKSRGAAWSELAGIRDVDRLKACNHRLETKLSGETALVEWMLGLLLVRVAALILKTFLS